MITEEKIAMAIAKQMSDDVDREILEKLGVRMRRFTLGTYLGQSCAVRVGYKGEEISEWIEQQPRELWTQAGYCHVDSDVYILDEKLYIMFALRWS